MKQINSPARKAMLAARRERQRAMEPGHYTFRGYGPLLVMPKPMRSKSDNPAYRKSIWPASKIERRATPA